MSTSGIGTEPNLRNLEEALKYGIVIIDKPQGPSSHEVSAFVRKILKLKVTGHTGTLDQNVSGVLVVLLENSRKIVNFIPNTDKKYVCLMKLSMAKGREELESAFDNFRGKIYQTPPLESAVAKRLRVRKIHSLSILEVRGNLVLFECECEAGTYIRKIVSDVGEVLGVKAEMAELRRVNAGDFSEKDAIMLQQLSDYYWAWKEKGDETFLRKCIHPVEELKIMKMTLTDEAAVKIRHGIKPKIGEIVKMDAGIIFKSTVGLFTLKGELIAVAESVISHADFPKLLESSKKEFPAANIIRVIHEF